VLAVCQPARSGLYSTGIHRLRKLISHLLFYCITSSNPRSEITSAPSSLIRRGCLSTRHFLRRYPAVRRLPFWAGLTFRQQNVAVFVEVHRFILHKSADYTPPDFYTQRNADRSYCILSVVPGWGLSVLAEEALTSWLARKEGGVLSLTGSFLARPALSKARPQHTHTHTRTHTQRETISKFARHLFGQVGQPVGAVGANLKSTCAWVPRIFL